MAWHVGSTGRLTRGLCTPVVPRSPFSAVASTRIYPRDHAKLYRQIQADGLLLAESPLGTPPERSSFPRRNRIVSGLAQAVIVVEAPERSGALITARLAHEQGREVFAVPGEMRCPKPGPSMTPTRCSKHSKVVNTASRVLPVRSGSPSGMCRKRCCGSSWLGVSCVYQGSATHVPVSSTRGSTCRSTCLASSRSE
ncbi:MAG: hypothetical protein CME13_18575 [Gemmatimonadetes bacterium]|nr:hypothetical protein [Gemmatimonadota bacterium]HCV22001.1 hypothetical protein [Candidatus Latescibacterota bacterium]